MRRCESSGFDRWSARVGWYVPGELEFNTARCPGTWPIPAPPRTLRPGAGCSHTLRKWSPPVSLTPFYPRGNPLTESMPFLASDGVHWLAYIEGVPSDPPPRLWRQVVLPGRRLRFDSANESRVTSHLPAGSPFLTDGRLQSLLDEAQLVPSPAFSPTWQSRGSTILRHPVIEWVTRAGQVGRVVLADWSRQWRRGANQRQVLLGRRRARS
jgi:hypothetical protein